MKNLQDMTDEELALSYADGNNRAFDLLLLRNQSKLFSYILFVVHDRDTAEDIFQETFVKVITRLQEGRYMVSGKFGAWIMRIAHNAIMDWYRDQAALRTVDTSADNDLSKLPRCRPLRGQYREPLCQLAGYDRRAPTARRTAANAARGGIHAFLPAAVV